MSETPEDRRKRQEIETEKRHEENRQSLAEMRKFREQARDRQPDISAFHNQTDDRRPNLTQSDPDRGQKRDDAEFLGREAAHVLPQGERDRQRDAARLQNPEEKRGLEQELKPEISLGGASSEPKAGEQEKGEQKAPEQKSALRRMMDRIKQQQTTEQPKPAEEQSRRM